MAEKTEKAAEQWVKERQSVGTLDTTHQYYDDNIKEWRFLKASYGGAKELIKQGLIKQHERESLTNYTRRMEEIYSFSYTKSIVDLFNFYLFKKPANRDLGGLAKESLWELFMKDCNLYGDEFDSYLVNQGIWSSVFGHIGLLIDKAPVTKDNLKEEMEDGIYPYLAKFFPTNILDWKFKKDPKTHRPYLAYLKLLDDDDLYRLWFTDHWEIWKKPVEKQTRKADGKEITVQPSDAMAEAELVDAGQNVLGEIPFVFLFNLKGSNPQIGVSDVHDVSRIDLSIMRNLSQGEEIINFAAFPMMRKPKKEVELGGGSGGGEDVAGPTAVLEFDPDKPDSKPDWMESVVEGPLGAIAKWIVQKVAEIYRSSNAGGAASTELNRQARSGIALKTEFLMLNSKLVGKAINLEQAEMMIIRYWLLWQQMWQKYKDEVAVERARTYEVEQLADDLANVLTASTIVTSKTFKSALDKKVVRWMLPAATDDQISEIDKEIEENAEKEPVTSTPPPDDDIIEDDIVDDDDEGDDV